MSTTTSARRPDEERVRKPVPPSDQTWLHMDRPNNLMHVRSLMWFDEPVGIDAVRRVLEERLIARHPVFRRRAVEHDGEWYWEDDPDFDLGNHVRVVGLEGDEEDLRTWIGEQFAVQLDRERPLWTIDLVTGIDGYATVMFTRFHHALADGIRLVQLMFSLCDPVDGSAVVPVSVGRAHHSAGLLATGAALARRSAGDAGDLLLGALKVPLRVAATLSPRLVREGLGLALHPLRVIDAVEGITSRENQSVNTIAEVSRILTAPPSTHTAWSGTPGVEKVVSWVRGIDLARVREIGRATDGTVNDVLLAVVSLALTRYLDEKDALVDEIAWLVPVSLVPFDADLPEDLGNHFSLVFLPMPLGLGSTGEAVSAMKERMLRIKHSVEPVITFGVQWMIAESPRALAVRLTDLFANKGVGVLTNVPGPREQVTFAGVPVAGTLGWVPMSGHQPLGISIFSYGGEVTIGVAGDAGLVPDPDRIAELIEQEYAAM
ncbi:WS/DGAT domain-containing protein [Nocardioides cavernae]|uniref:WS/DGAT domain-containing protein n=1 Tax=Nocardioides TaxID=1839 RepID=UPI0012E33AD3|nr:MULTISPECIES: WS/DGAT domain-containing protein [Nocardioides]MCK9824104.1 WS/DGAT domain-containing protein [Nocardioides cavernae]